MGVFLLRLSFNSHARGIFSCILSLSICICPSNWRGSLEDSRSTYLSIPLPIWIEIEMEIEMENETELSISTQREGDASSFCMHAASRCLSVGAFCAFALKVLLDLYVLMAMLLAVSDWVLLVFSRPPLFSALVVWWLPLVGCLLGVFWLLFPRDNFFHCPALWPSSPYMCNSSLCHYHAPS